MLTFSSRNDRFRSSADSSIRFHGPANSQCSCPLPFEQLECTEWGLLAIITRHGTSIMTSFTGLLIDHFFLPYLQNLGAGASRLCQSTTIASTRFHDARHEIRHTIATTQASRSHSEIHQSISTRLVVPGSPARKPTHESCFHKWQWLDRSVGRWFRQSLFRQRDACGCIICDRYG